MAPDANTPKLHSSLMVAWARTYHNAALEFAPRIPVRAEKNQFNVTVDTKITCGANSFTRKMRHVLPEISMLTAVACVECWTRRKRRKRSKEKERRRDGERERENEERKKEASRCS